MADLTPDPDEIECPRCHAAPGEVCRTPGGRQTSKIHSARRSGADAELPPRLNPGTAEGRSKAGKVAAARRREGRAVVAELYGQTRARAIVREAENVARDAVRWDRQRMAVRDLSLQAALTAAATFVEVLEGYRRLQLDTAGRPMTMPIEVDGPRGPRVIEAPDYRGSFGPDDVKAAAGAYAIALDKLRLEEGSATSRTEVSSIGLPDLTDEALAAMAERARQLQSDHPPHRGEHDGNPE